MQDKARFLYAYSNPVVASLILKTFTIKAVIADGQLDDLFDGRLLFYADLVDHLIKAEFDNAPVSGQIKKFLSTVSQKSCLQLETINKIKSYYGTAYFDLMNFNYSEYLEVG